MGHPVSHMQVAQLLYALHYSLQGNAKTKEGKQHPDRDAQFRYIQRQSESFLGRGWPVISVDTKKKELVGNHANSGQEWQPEGQPVPVDVHDFPDPDIPKAVPRGVDDQQHNLGWVAVGCSQGLRITIRRLGAPGKFGLPLLYSWVAGNRSPSGASIVRIATPFQVSGMSAP